MSFTEKPGNREHLERSDDCPKTVRPRLAAGSGSSSLSDWAQKKIADMILRRQLAGGESVVEGRLAEELTVSRTPMREALLRLEGEGLLVKQTGRSYTVRKVSPSEFFQSMRVREIVEQEAISLSLKNIPKQSLLDIKETIDKLISTGGVVEDFWDADNSVHEIFCTHSGNVVLSNIVRKLRVTTRLFESSNPFGRSKEDCAEHMEIIEAAISGDVKLTKESIVNHLRNLQRDVMESLVS